MFAFATGLLGLFFFFGWNFLGGDSGTKGLIGQGERTGRPFSNSPSTINDVPWPSLRFPLLGLLTPSAVTLLVVELVINPFKSKKCHKNVSCIYIHTLQISCLSLMDCRDSSPKFLRTLSARLISSLISSGVFSAALSIKNCSCGRNISNSSMRTSFPCEAKMMRKKCIIVRLN